MQLANTPPLQSTAPGLHPVSIHQTSPLVRGSKHPITAYYSIYRPRKDERLSWPSWLTCSGRFTHNFISGHPSAAGWAQDRSSSPVTDRRSTTVPHHQLVRRAWMLRSKCPSQPEHHYLTESTLVHEPPLQSVRCRIDFLLHHSFLLVLSSRRCTQHTKYLLPIKCRPTHTSCFIFSSQLLSTSFSYVSQ